MPTYNNGLLATGTIDASGITSGSFASGAITAAAIATNAIGAAELAADAVDEIWDEPLAAHTTANTPGWSQARFATKTITFTGGAGAGAVGSVALFTVTGEVLIVALIPFCSTLLTEAAATATIALGVTGSTSLFIAATNAVDIDANEFWVDTAPDANGVAVPAALRDIVITDNIINTVAAQNVDSGVIRYDVYYLALSSDGAIAAA